MLWLLFFSCVAGVVTGTLVLASVFIASVGDAAAVVVSATVDAGNTYNLDGWHWCLSLASFLLMRCSYYRYDCCCVVRCSSVITVVILAFTVISVNADVLVGARVIEVPVVAFLP